MRFPNAPGGVKMACGENPKRVYGDKGGPMTRMGNAAHFRSLFERAKDYGKQLDKWTESRSGDKPTRDFQLGDNKFSAKEENFLLAFIAMEMTI